MKTKMSKYILFLILFLTTASFLFAQNDLEDKSLYYDTYEPEEVIDDVYGITRYEPLNKRLGGDSVRHDNSGYAAENWKEDYYNNEQLLHKGYYGDGKLKTYTNYYPDGQEERNYRIINGFKSKMVKYYPDGTKKSEVTYYGKDAWRWEDYYPSGQLEYLEQWDKNFEYYEVKESYYKNGTLKSIFELKKKRKMLFEQKKYHENGELKEEGELTFNMFDYSKIGTWKIYNKQGILIKEEIYKNGKLFKTKEK